MTRAAPRCAFIGDESVVAECLDAALAHGLEAVVVATRHAGVLEAARRCGVATIDTRDAQDLAGALRRHAFDVLFSIAYQRVLPPSILEQATTCINFHDGPLPGYGGLNVTTWAVFNGEARHGITWHEMTPEVDAGGVVLASSFPVADDETAFSLNARCYEEAVATFGEVAVRVAGGTVVAEPQPATERRMYRRRDRPRILVDTARPAEWSARAARALDVGTRIDNLIGAVRLVIDDEVLVPTTVRAVSVGPGAAAGTIVDIGSSSLRLATVDGDLVLDDLRSPNGNRLDVVSLARQHGLSAGRVLPPPAPALASALDDLDPVLADAEPWWIEQLEGLEPSTPAMLTGFEPRPWTEVPVTTPDGITGEQVAAGVAAWLSGMSGAEAAVVTCTDPRSRRVVERLAPLVQSPVCGVPVAAHDSLAELTGRVGAHVGEVTRRGPFHRDLLGRAPRLRRRTIEPVVVVDLEMSATEPAPDTGLLRVVHWAEGASRVSVRHRAPVDVGARIAAQLAKVLQCVVTDPGREVAALDLLSDGDRDLIGLLNATEVDVDRSLTIDGLFRDQVARTPDAPGISSGGRTLTYSELAVHVSRLSAGLARAGVSRGHTVGIALPRGIDMVAAVLAVLERGAAYLPLDPAYPEDRLRFMVRDSGTRVIIAEPATSSRFDDADLVVVPPPSPSADVVDIAVDGQHRPDDLAYLIYTSGSTGLPKGVQLEHRQVVNFFAAMDAVIDHDPPGVWLAVTSLSFDISVLELLWTLTRGFHVVVKRDSGFRPTPATTARPTRPVSMSMFYFAAGEAAAGDGYRLLLESAAWADANGFEAVWTPERHFHEFGAPYPNPSVVAAALAARTRRIAIRAGSVVLPLHSPVRVAEEWAVVDNLSGGRVGISFAAGWQPNDFVLNPSAFATARDSLPALIETVQRLWRGETVDLPGHDGSPVQVRTLPRPVQPELPTWVTSAGTPATYERAGRLGLNVLTHLLGQTVDQLAENIRRYRAAWHAAGHAGDGRVTLMLHAFLDHDPDRACETARRPLKGYLGTAVGLLKDIASAFPTFSGSGKDADEAFRSLSADELSQLLDIATERYLSTSGLFGTVDDAVAMIRRVASIEVDEVACLIDFGIDTDSVLASLELLGEVHRRVRRGAESQGTAERDGRLAAAADETIADLVSAHGVTHLQCTPSLAAMLVANPPDRDALGSIAHLMVGGEALPVALATELRQLLTGRFTNMYGPTETTIWSLVHEIANVPTGPVPIGRPIANTEVHVLDRLGREVPVGVFGELHIGGDGVARGYHERSELTGSRFVDRPGVGRVYATGDIARISPDGHVEFGGRVDNQVKIRGHRIELGEIEATLDDHPSVAQSVVITRGDGEPSLIAFVTLHDGAHTTPDELRRHVAAALPDVMVPTGFGILDAFPMTPNGKVDRKRLPGEVAAATPDHTASSSAVSTRSEVLVGDVWIRELDRPVGRDDNFFDIGGHSLLAIKVFRRLVDLTGMPLTLTDVFRYPTVRTFAAYLDSLQDPSAGPPLDGDARRAPTGTARGAMRRRAMGGRSVIEGAR